MSAFGTAVARLAAPPYENTSHLIVLRDGETVFRHAFAGHGPDERREVASVTKAVLSTVVMLAVREGLLDVDATLGDLLGARVPEPRRAATVRHYLTMSSGAEWQGDDLLDEVLALPSGVADRLLAVPQAFPPGTVFAYDNWASHLLACAVRERIGDIDEFAAAHLFTPLGITGWHWPHDVDGVPWGGAKLELSANGLARLGEAWRTDALGLGDLLAEATSPQIAPGPEETRRYGWLFWTEELDGHPVYMAAGWAGQLVYVVPHAALTIVLTGDISRWHPGIGDNLDVVRELASSLAA